MGGRGTSYGGQTQGSTTGKSGGKFYDLTQKYQGMTLHEFEEAIRPRKNEFVGIFDKEGKLIIAGTSYRNGSVSLPVEAIQEAQKQGVNVVLTHNHPNAGDRGVGGTFSTADVFNHAGLDLYQTRAVAQGKNEFAFMITTRPNADKKKLMTYAVSVDRKGTMKQVGDSLVDKMQKKYKMQGKTMTTKQMSTIYLNAIRKVWRHGVSETGYEYDEVDTKRW